MRRVVVVFALALMAGLAGCATPSHWEKPGVDQEATKADLLDCRRLASQEAFRYHAFDVGFARYGAPWWGYSHRPGYGAFRSRLDGDRMYAEHRLANFCMRSKGYERVPDELRPG